MVARLGEGEQTQFPGSADLELAEWKHTVWLQTEQGPPHHGPGAPRICTNALPNFSLLPSKCGSQLLKSTKWYLLCPQNIC